VNGTIPGWRIAGGPSGVFHPGSSQFALPLPDGIQTAFSDGGTIFQTLSETLKPNTTYRLTVYVGRRLDFSFAGYAVALYAGSDLLGSENSQNPAPGRFAASVVTFTSEDADSREGQPLRIVLTSNGPQVNFDKVTLDIVQLAYPAERAASPRSPSSTGETRERC
jgi:hypothetical protein